MHLKRVRNSLLNVSTLPPEILGDIFHRNVILKSTFGGLEKGSYNFLLVCHHWFEVASNTPELWSCWGNSLQDWKKRCLRSPAAPLDLVLDGMQFMEGSLDDTLRNALQDRAARDTIRRVHLGAEDSEILSSVLASLTAGRQRLRPGSLESLVLWAEDRTPVDVSDFFAHFHLSKLRHLELVNCTISSWDNLLPQTTLLTTLELTLNKTSPAPTMSQLLSILASNPRLQGLALYTGMVPSDNTTGSSPQVALHQLRRLHLTGRIPHLFSLLHRLEYPDRMEDLSINVHDCTTSDISQTIGPYLRDHIQRRGESQNGLSLFVTNDTNIRVHLSDVDETHSSTRMPAFARIVVDRASRCQVFMKDLYPHFPGLKMLNLDTVNLSTVFPKPDHKGPLVYEKIPISLQHISLEWPFLNYCDWSPLTAFLSHRASTSNPIVSLTILESPHMCLDVMECINDMVERVRIARMGQRCPLARC